MRDPWGRRLDVFDVISLVLGLGFLGLSVVCVIASVTVFSTLGDSAETYEFGEGFLKGLRGLGMVFFPLAALVTFFTGWTLAGDLLRRWWRQVRRRDQE
jgi:ABC-type dipeptide/oligopeptide/nickel transport system permease subunit